MPTWIWWLVLAGNAATLALFAWDKWMARLGRRRIAEATLLTALFACGCVGAWIGMRLFRHKTSKLSFRWRALALTLFNPLWLLVWLEFR